MITSMITLGDHLTNHNTNPYTESVSATNSPINFEGDQSKYIEITKKIKLELEKKREKR